MTSLQTAGRSSLLLDRFAQVFPGWCYHYDYPFQQKTVYAHALGKRVGLLTSTAEDIPFDLKHYPAIVYGDRIAELKSRLRGWIEWCIAHPSESLVRADVPVRVLIEGAEVGPDQVIKLCRDQILTWSLRLDFAIHNPTTLLYPKGSFQVGIVAPSSFQTCESTREQEAPPKIEYQYGAMGGAPTPIAVPQTEHLKADRFPLADGRALFVLGWWADVLFPTGWAAISCNMRQGRRAEARRGFEAKLRELRETLDQLQRLGK